MRITGLTVRNLGPFADLALEFPEGKDDTLADVYLFVGENGTGKSTLLYALAAAVERDRGSLGRLKTRGREGGWEVVIDNSAGKVGISESSVSISGPQMDSRSNPATFFALVYGGNRDVGRVEINSVTGADVEPYTNNLQFSTTANMRQFAQWVANQWFTSAALRVQGRSDEADQGINALARVEKALHDVTGLDLRFDVNARSRDVSILVGSSRLSFEVLPDGLKSLLSWIGDLYARMDRLTWENDLPIEQRPFLLLLDEIDVHLHPTWQRKVLPIVQRLFPKAQIFATTHSPFVVGSAADARIYPLVRNPDGTTRLMSPAEVGQGGEGTLIAGLTSRKGLSYPAILRQVFGIKELFDLNTNEELKQFYALRNQVLSGDKTLPELERAAQELADRYSTEVQNVVMGELHQVRRRLEQA